MTTTQTTPKDDILPAGGDTFADLLGSADHKAIGRLWIVASLIFTFVALVLSAVVGAERLPESTLEGFLGDNSVPLWALGRITLLFLGVVPLAIGLGTYVAPLQVGASTIAFPRAAAASFWVWLVSAGLVISAFSIEGGPGGTSETGINLWLTAHIGLALSLGMAAVCLVTTVLTLRVPGMTLLRTPAFAFSMLVFGSMLLLTLPVLVANLGLIWLDHSQGALLFGEPASQYVQISWVFSQPSLYVAAIPALGIVAELVPVATRGAQKGHGVVLGAIGAFGGLSFGAWLQPGLNGTATERLLYIVLPFLTVVPLLVMFGGFAVSAKANRPRGFAPMVGATLGLLLIEAGVIFGMLSVIDPLELQGTTFATAQMNAVLIGTAVVLLAGLQYWSPKIFGNVGGTALLNTAAAITFLGGLVLVAADAISGFLDQPDTYLADDADGFVLSSLDNASTIETLNLVALVGSAIAALGLLVAFGAMTKLAGRRKTQVDDNPWDAHTLEWATTSPPPIGNFASIPEVASATPLLSESDGESDNADSESADAEAVSV